MIFILLTTTVIAAFEMKCPDDLGRTFRTKHVCKNITAVDRYSCLLDQDTNVYRESCEDRADYVRPGQKYVRNGRRKNTNCSSLKYQPFKFWSNRLSQCVFKKSMCSELGQILHWNGSSMTDSTCRCDYTAGFAFVTEPRDKCFCTPTVEDCMCYIVGCQQKMQLTQDYKCRSGEDLSSPYRCPPIIKTAVDTNVSFKFEGEEKEFKEKIWIKILITCPILTVFILLATYGGIEYRRFVQTSTRTESNKNERQTSKIAPEEAVEKLRVIFELVEQLLNKKEFDKDFQEELSAAHPNYMNVLQSYKRDLLRNDCGIIIAGETSAGKTTLINQLVGANVFVTSNLAATGTVCRIRNSKSIFVKTYDKEECLIDEQIADNLPALKSLLKKYTDYGNNPPEWVDVHLPVPILKGNVILVDTPGIGENETLDTILLDVLPHAVSFVFIVNARNAGGIHSDRLLRILETVIEKKKEMPCFVPEEVIFLTNQWDAITNTKTDENEEDEHTKTWNAITLKLEKEWPGFQTDRLFKISLKQVRERRKTPFTEQYKKFEAKLTETIARNKNKRVDYYFRFVQKFVEYAKFGICSRIHLLKQKDEYKKEDVLKNKETVCQLERVLNEKKMKAKEFKTEMITKLAEDLTCYLNSDIGKHEILNPAGLKPIRSVPMLSFTQEYCKRIDRGVNRWCESVGTVIVMQEIKDKMNELLSDVQSMIHDIEEDITGLTRSTHIPSFDVFTHSALHRFVIGTSINIMELMKLLQIPHSIREFFTPMIKEQKAEELYKVWVSRYSNDRIRSNFEMIFGTEYDRIVDLVFEDEIPRKIKSLKLTIDKLLCELSDNSRTEISLMELNGLVQDINTKIEDFIVEAEV